MKSLKNNRIFVLIWMILALSVFASLCVGYQSLKYISKLNFLFYVSLIRLATTCILIVISIKLWQIVKSYTDNNKWQPHFYQKLRQIGYWSIVLTLLSPIIEVAINLHIVSNSIAKIGKQHLPTYYVLFKFCMKVLIDATPMWVLTLTVFLFAELLQVANQIKTENESFI